MKQLAFFLRILILMMGCCSLYGDLNLEMDEAKSDVEAGDFDQAYELYQRLSAQVKEGWQKALLQYNLATVNLIEGKNEAAIALLQSVLEKNPPALVSAKIHTNLAVAYWRLSQSIHLNETTVDALYTTYLSLLFNLRQSLKEILLAEEADCALILAEGGDHCVKDHSLMFLKSAIQNKMTEIKTKFQKLQIEILSFNDVLPLLLSCLYSLEDELKNLTAIEDSRILKQQMDRVVNQLKTWTPLWNRLKNPSAAHQDAALNALYENYLELLEQLENQSIPTIKNFVSSMKKEINALIVERYSSAPSKDLLNSLIHSYQRTLIFLMPSEIRSLIDQQNAIKRIFNERKLEIEMLEQAQKYLMLSVKQWEKQHIEWAQVNFLFAYKMIQRLDWSIHHRYDDIILFLEHLIQEERINVLLAQFAKKAQIKEAIERSVESQILFANKFWTIVPRVQKENFRNHCIFKPWNQVIPLFEKGLGYLKQAAHANALVEWTKALTLLQAPVDPRASCQTQSKQNLPEKKQSAWSNSIEDVLRRLQTMEQQDREKATIPFRGTSEEKLW